ncbi:MAG: H+/Cl- antiporter ClcA [Flavobacteriales bacterium]|jgi:H+/Cl- antiporter ClcA
MKSIDSRKIMETRDIMIGLAVTSCLVGVAVLGVFFGTSMKNGPTINVDPSFLSALLLIGVGCLTAIAQKYYAFKNKQT